MLNIEEPFKGKYAFLQLGFRPFFSAAIVFSALGILAWMLVYFTGWALPADNYVSISWHAHEMVFGYTLAVVSGFLLTAIKNWTGVQTLRGKPLLILFLFWLVARILPFVLNQSSLFILATVDLLFNFLLALAITQPILKVRQWQNVVFPVIGSLIFLSNLVFYSGLLGLWTDGIHYGIYSGFYILLALIFIMGRRVIPFFIEKGVDESFQAKNWQWLDVSSLLLLAIFIVSDLINPVSMITALFAGLLFVLHSMRLYGWYTRGIWSKNLVWILYVGYAWIAFGFLLKVLSITHGISAFLAIHSFAYGGIGMITIGMMARVALGHTGRNVFDPPRILKTAFVFMLIGAVVRVIFPLINIDNYALWIGIAQVLWILAFTIVLTVYLPMLIKPRVDGQPG
ncbi:MAG: NnrS family protein [Gammaproteobacteria bacterium]|nr:NnrS family protein [Gammaproteobacteria bacterium]MCW9005132.1 NnrS family protein [Gammaproteobacteria bacterium]MCW9056646.1 NnrS family protein [Gammaproteobacteria bacterium]